MRRAIIPKTGGMSGAGDYRMGYAHTAHGAIKDRLPDIDHLIELVTRITAALA